MTIKILEVLKANVVLVNVNLLSEPGQQDQFRRATDEHVEMIAVPPIPVPDLRAEIPTVFTMPKQRIEITCAASRSSIERQYPSKVEDLDHLAGIASLAINLTELGNQPPTAYGFNIDLVYRPRSVQFSGEYLADRLFLRQRFDTERWALRAGSGILRFEGDDAQWSIKVEPRANDPSGRKVYLSLNLHKEKQQIPSPEEIRDSLRDTWNRSRDFAKQLDGNL